jgi:hypothetical protein
VGAEGGPTFGFHPATGEAKHLGDCGSKVVVADLPGRHSAQHVESVHVALEERFLPAEAKMRCTAFPEYDSRNANR